MQKTFAKEVNTSEQRLTKIFLEDNNFNLSKIYQKLSINMNDTYITNTEPSLVAIKELFIPYIEKGVCENIKRRNITVSKIIENVFNLANDLYVREISVSDFKNKVNEIYNEKKNSFNEVLNSNYIVNK